MVPSGDDEVVVIVRDFTERTRLETELARRVRELQHEQEFTSTVVNTAPIVLVLCDDEGGVVRFNDTTERLFGHPDDERAWGRKLWDVFVAEDDRAEIEDAFRRVHPLRPVDVRARWLTKDGAVRVIDASIAHILDGQGLHRRIVAGLDVTDLVAQREELRASRSRIVEAGDAERRRLERNLHDGAQQRLVSLSLAPAARVRRSSRDDPGAAEYLLDGAAERADPRDRGSARARPRHPPGGAHRPRPFRGARGARRAHAAARRAGNRARTAGCPGRWRRLRTTSSPRRSPTSPSTPSASSVTVRAEHRNGDLLVEVADDGVGRRRSLRAARVCAASPIASRRWTGGSRSRAPPAAAPASRRSSRS